VELVVNIPKEYEKVLEVWEVENGLSAAKWLENIIMGNLKELVRRKVEARITVEDHIKNIDWASEKQSAIAWANETRENY